MPPQPRTEPSEVDKVILEMARQIGVLEERTKTNRRLMYILLLLVAGGDLAAVSSIIG